MIARSAVLVCLTVLTTLPVAGVDASSDQQANRTNAPVPSAVPAPAASAMPVDPTPGDYVIGADDVLSVVFWRDQQLSGEVLVRPDGKISLPLLDDVPAAGFTPRQLRDRILIEARRFLNEAMVTVVVKQTNSRKVYITGLVVRPGQYALSTDMTVLQLIATAGGLQDYAKVKEISVVRIEHGQTVTVPFDYKKMVSAKPGATPNFALRPGDTVVIP